MIKKLISNKVYSSDLFNVNTKSKEQCLSMIQIKL